MKSVYSAVRTGSLIKRSALRLYRVKAVVFRFVTPCNLAACQLSFAATCGFHLHSKRCSQDIPAHTHTDRQPRTKSHDAMNPNTLIPSVTAVPNSSPAIRCCSPPAQTVYDETHGTSDDSSDISIIFFNVFTILSPNYNQPPPIPSLQHQLTTLNNSSIKKNKPIKLDKQTALNGRHVCYTRSVQIRVQSASVTSAAVKGR